LEWCVDVKQQNATSHVARYTSHVTRHMPHTHLTQSPVLKHPTHTAPSAKPHTTHPPNILTHVTLPPSSHTHTGAPQSPANATTRPLANPTHVTPPLLHALTAAPKWRGGCQARANDAVSPPLPCPALALISQYQAGTSMHVTCPASPPAMVCHRRSLHICPGLLTQHQLLAAAAKSDACGHERQLHAQARATDG
jgi:hypothetical protein